MASRPAVPSTRVLAIGTFPHPPAQEELKGVMSREVPATLQLYLDGRIDQMFVRQDMLGVVFLMNLVSVEDTRVLLGGLPLGLAGMMTFELIPLGPLAPLGALLSSGF